MRERNLFEVRSGSGGMLSQLVIARSSENSKEHRLRRDTARMQEKVGNETTLEMILRDSGFAVKINIEDAVSLSHRECVAVRVAVKCR